MISRFNAKIAAILTTLAVSMLGWAMLSPRTASAAPLTCNEIELVTAFARSEVLAELNSRIAGEEYRINSRKRLVIHGVNDVQVQGCEITVITQLTLKRRIRRDAHGTVTARATVSVNSLGSNTFDVSFDNVRVTDVSLSHMLEIGEAIYRWFANRAPSNFEVIRIEL